MTKLVSCLRLPLLSDFGFDSIFRIHSSDLFRISSFEFRSSFAFRHSSFEFVTIVFVLFLTTASAFTTDLTLWYAQPAPEGKAMEEALPIGNGRMGGLIFGTTRQERIIINESSLWTGDENPSGNYDSMGAYQVFGNLLIHFPNHEQTSEYRRDLNLAEAVSHVRYTAKGVRYERECFASHPAGVLAAHFTADKKHSYSGTIELQDSHQTLPVLAGNRIIAAGQLANGLKYEWQALVLPEGGTLGTNGSNLTFSNCDALTLFVAAGTDYARDPQNNFRGTNPHARLTMQIDAASRTGYARLKAAHLKDFQSMFNRVSAHFGDSSSSQRALPADQRKLLAVNTVDPELEELLFQYGRYLLISCSRPGGLPANLQGLWNDRNDPPWHSDYHANINVQMNYWPAEVANLAECQLPFFDLIESQLPAWRKAAAASPDLKTPDGGFTKRGFAIRTSHNIFGGLGWKWDKTANAWYCRHFWDHFAFSGDKSFLRDAAYPILKETCEFWEDHLKVLPDGRLVVPNGWSPEHGPEEDGVSYNQEIVWDLFNGYLHAAQVLGLDQPYRSRIEAMRDKLVTPGVGTWGQLLEWMTEKTGTNAVPNSPELDTPKDHHRHTSHLYAVYPGDQINRATAPELARAAKVSLDARGIASDSDVREWSFAWRAALYARLGDGDKAHQMLQSLFSRRNTCPNLFGLHPPMQIDGNFGITAALCEMLLQSHAGEIVLLPALPRAWPSGSVKGLRARGGFEISIEWKDRKLVDVTIKSTSGEHARIRYGAFSRDEKFRKGESVAWKLPAGQEPH